MPPREGGFMERFSNKDLGRAILEILDQSSVGGVRKAHKMTIIGRGDAQPGMVEERMSIQFTANERARAAQTFEELKRNGYIQSTLDDLIDPENWVTITEAGTEYLRRDMRDHIDEKLSAVSPHLVELRKGMWDALARTSPDAARQAAHSARELIDQLLKEGTSAGLKTRKERFAHLMRNIGDHDDPLSKGDLQIIKAGCDFIEAIHNKLIAEAHARRPSQGATVRTCVETAEHILQLVFPEHG
jgi:DNA-binding PadR family transcriptional regulator